MNASAQSRPPIGPMSHTSSGYEWLPSESDPAFVFPVLSDYPSHADFPRSGDPQDIWTETIHRVMSGEVSPSGVTLHLSSNLKKSSDEAAILPLIKAFISYHRPSLSRAAALTALFAAREWSSTRDPRWIQRLNFNTIHLVSSTDTFPACYRPSRTSTMIPSGSEKSCYTSTPRFVPTPAAFTNGRHDYEGLCEVMWDSTRAPGFECWRV